MNRGAWWGRVHRVAKSWRQLKWLSTHWTVDHQTPPSLWFPTQECWSEMPFPSPGNLPDPGIKPRSPALQAVLYHWTIREALDTHRYYQSIFPASLEITEDRTTKSPCCYTNEQNLTVSGRILWSIPTPPLKASWFSIMVLSEYELEI